MNNKMKILLKFLSIGYKISALISTISMLVAIIVLINFGHEFGFDAKSTDNLNNLMEYLLSVYYSSLIMTAILFVIWLALDEFK